MNITFLGAGVFGQALAEVARENNHQSTFFDPYKYPDISLETALKDASVAILTAPSDAVEPLLPQLSSDLPLICASKGFLSFQPFQRFRQFSALGGATFAKNLTSHTPQVANRQGKIELTASSELAEQIFQTDWLDIDYQWEDPEEHDITRGIMLCGALKNLFALGAGLLGCPPIDLNRYNQHSDLEFEFYPYLREAEIDLQQVLAANLADPSLIASSCGIDDIALSCTPDSRNFRFGRDHQAPEGTTLEGLSVIKKLHSTPDFILPENASLINKITQAAEDLFPNLTESHP